MRIRYSRFTGSLADSLPLEDLLAALGDYLLQSGFDGDGEGAGEMDFEELERAILEALDNSSLLDEDQRRQLEQATEQQLRELLRSIAERLAQAGYIQIEEPYAPPTAVAPGSGRAGGRDAPPVRFEITDKALDFLGFKTLRDLLAGLGKSSFGRHDTCAWATGVETSGGSRPYEFGDTLNLDVPATIAAALRRAGLPPPGGPALDLEYADLRVHEAEYQSSCATVVLLDCSHSMILYGEDRFTPAKRVALALAHLIRTQFPGDSLQLALFHDSAEEVPLSRLAQVRVGPFYTNTREGLRLARRLLSRQRKDMRQIVLITDGKPSALTLEDGRIYKNAFGLDPLVIAKTLEEVVRCRRAGILINTFMLAADYGLVQFVQRVTALARGKAYFTTPHSLGQYLLLDYLNHKSRRVH
ncbi:MAG: vWA domain-containing protein [Terriglobales bacterium]